MRTKRDCIDIVLAVFFWCVPSLLNASEMPNNKVDWTGAEKSIIKSLSLDSLSSIPIDPSNRFLSSRTAQELGRKLFFDKRLSESQEISCSSCHIPEKYFTDGLPTALGVSKLRRNTPTLLGIAHSRWFYSDGRRDSLWSQAITPLEAADEMGSTRIQIVQLIFKDQSYKKLYEEVFGSIDTSVSQLPDQGGPYGDKLDRRSWRMLPPSIKDEVNKAFANVGRAIAAYQTTLMPRPGKFEAFAKSLDNLQNQSRSDLSIEEQRGLKLFIDIGKTQCLMCHNGPLFTNGGFHNIGTAMLEGEQLDLGRVVGIQAVLADEFNCFGRYSGIPPARCESLRFLKSDDTHSPLLGAYKVPTLRGVGKTAPYGHLGNFTTLAEMLDHYINPPDKSKFNHELEPLQLTDQEKEDLIKFLKVL